jgi:hypothetical protein
MAFSRSGDPNLGEFADAVILKTFGQVPEDLAETQTASTWTPTRKRPAPDQQSKHW